MLDAYGDIDPTRILIKTKLHLLQHLPEDIPRFGPAVRAATEIFECFNAIFRFCSVLSNHQAPSRDIARTLAEIERVKHIASGGFWVENGKVTQAAQNVASIIDKHPIIRQHFGWKVEKTYQPGMRLTFTGRLLTLRHAGSVKLISKKQAHPREFTEPEMTQLAADQPSIHKICSSSQVLWTDGAHVIARSGDVCTTGAWVMYHEGSGEEVRLHGTSNPFQSKLGEASPPGWTYHYDSQARRIARRPRSACSCEGVLRRR